MSGHLAATANFSDQRTRPVICMMTGRHRDMDGDVIHEIGQQ